jgi:hypothetical protein
MEEREKSFKEGQTGPTAPDNWMWPFRDSVELKNRVAKDLQAASHKATLERLIRSGQLPIIAPVPTSNSGSTPNFNITFQFANAGQVAALKVVWWDNRRTSRNIGMIQPNAFADSLPYALEVNELPARGRLEIQYETATAYRVHDTHVVHVNQNHQVLTELRKRELTTGPAYEIG